MNRPTNLLYYLQTASVSDEPHSDPLRQEKIRQKENGVNVKQVSERSKSQAARIARDKLKQIFPDEIDTYACCRECCDNRNCNEEISENL